MGVEHGHSAFFQSRDSFDHISSFALLTIELPGATDLGYNWTAAPHPHAGGSHGSARSTPRCAPDAISAVVQWRVHPAPMEVLRDRTPGARAV